MSTIPRSYAFSQCPNKILFSAPHNFPAFTSKIAINKSNHEGFCTSTTTKRTTKNIDSFLNEPEQTKNKIEHRERKIGSDLTYFIVSPKIVVEPS